MTNENKRHVLFIWKEKKKVSENLRRKRKRERKRWFIFQQGNNDDRPQKMDLADPRFGKRSRRDRFDQPNRFIGDRSIERDGLVHHDEEDVSWQVSGEDRARPVQTVRLQVDVHQDWREMQDFLLRWLLRERESFQLGSRVSILLRGWSWT